MKSQHRQLTTTPLTIPRINSNDEAVEIVAWHAKTGDLIEVGAEICEFSTSKAGFLFASPAAGYLQIVHGKGERVRVGEIFAKLCATAEETQRSPDCLQVTDGGPIFSQRAKELLALHGLQEKDFSSKKFVTEKDILNQVAGKFEISIAKEAEIQILSQAYRQALRSSLTAVFPAQNFIARMADVKSTTAAGLAFACARAIEKNQWILKQFADPSLEATLNYAMDLDQGIKPMFAKDFFSWTLKQWNEQIAQWSLKISRNELQLSDLTIGRITITDLSALGVQSFEPLLVGSQSAILGLGSDLFNGKMSLVSATLAFDHRVHSGRQCALFLQDLRSAFSDL